MMGCDEVAEVVINILKSFLNLIWVWRQKPLIFKHPCVKRNPNEKEVLLFQQEHLNADTC